MLSRLAGIAAQSGQARRAGDQPVAVASAGSICSIVRADRPTSSLRAQRSNPESCRGGILDCFAALAMTAVAAQSPQAYIPAFAASPPPAVQRSGSGLCPISARP
ncbi:hypothetical protein GPL17_08175 [Bradyrhizobium yuanmingense]|nr:hypothetical protein [Bradyrhizobium yuanmingense]